MSANFKPNQNEYKNLTPFKCWLLHQINNWGITNFPFVESDFDELNNYGMLMKMMKALNDVISNENKVEQDMTNLFGAFTELQSFVNNYFDNLDVQDEINNKLDDMVEDGTFEQLIADYTTIPALTSRVEDLEEDNLTEMVVVGDSYTALPASNWAEQVASQLHLNLHKHATSSMGYLTAVGGNTFIDSLHWGETQTTKLHTKYVICYGGINDNSQNKENLKTAVKEFCEEAKTQYPNARIIIVGPQSTANAWATSNNLYLLNAIQEGALESGVAFANSQKWLLNNPESYTNLYDSDLVHPSALGYKVIASKMLSIINGDNQNNPFIKITPASSYSSNSSIRTITDQYKTHIFWKISSVTMENNSTITLGSLTTNSLPFINNEDPLFIYAYDNTYNFYTNFLGCARIHQDGRVLAVNSSGTNYTGAIVITGDLYVGMMYQ